jgi:hypothetical protein
MDIIEEAVVNVYIVKLIGRLDASCSSEPMSGGPNAG